MTKLLTSLPARPEAALAIVLVGMVLVLVMPLSRLVLDVLTILSMSSCLLILLMAVRVQSPVQLLTFPALILITTMLRLALNVASTKMILLEGQAGHVIETFGRVVMGSNLLVGLCVFAIVSVVQFLVVAKGADRVAEVGARFSLDAMPGKQMSIDGDLRAGALSAEQASARRDRLDIESRFFGGMDGAMKFVKGDAVAGLVIAVVNVLGGVASGMAYHGMDGGTALARFATLSVGDAMVSQIPSFMVAVAAGLIATRVTSNQGEQVDLGRQIADDLRRHPTSLVYVGALSLMLALVPGFPRLTFALLGLACVGAGVWMMRSARRQQELPAGFARPMASFQAPLARAAPVFIDEDSAVFEAPLAVLLPRALAERIDPALLDRRVDEVRRRLQLHWGAPWPGLRCGLAAPGDDATLRWLQQGLPLAALAWRDDAALQLGEASPSDDGVLGLPGFPDAAWQPGGRGGAMLEDCIARVVEHLCLRDPARLLTHEQFHALMRALRESHPQLAEGMAAAIPLPVLTEVVRSLLREGFSLRAMPQICDCLLGFAPLPADPNEIAELVVTGLSRLRCRDLAPGERLACHLVSPEIEQVLQAYAQAAGAPAAGQALPDADAFREVRSLLAELARQHPRGRIHLLCRGPSRLMVAELASMVSPRLRVFSFRGVNPRFGIEIVSTLQLPAQTLARLQADAALLAGPEAEPGFDPLDLDDGAPAPAYA